MHASNYPARTLHIGLVQLTNGGHAVVLQASQQTRAIAATRMDFTADGFDVMSLPAISQFSRGLDGSMLNTVASKLDPDQWEKMWQVFRHSGVVVIRTSVATVNAPTVGFEQASADFEQCLAELDLVAPAPTPNTGLPE
jgi:hypothetical protein